MSLFSCWDGHPWIGVMFWTHFRESNFLMFRICHFELLIKILVQYHIWNPHVISVWEGWFQLEIRLVDAFRQAGYGSQYSLLGFHGASKYNTWEWKGCNKLYWESLYCTGDVRGWIINGETSFVMHWILKGDHLFYSTETSRLQNWYRIVNMVGCVDHNHY